MSIFRSTFKPSIRAQLEARQKAIADYNLNYFNSRNAWVRMSSAVNVGGSPALAQQYVLQGGVLYPGQKGYGLKSGVGNGANNSYSTTTPAGNIHRLGIRPMPGITGVEIQSKGAYGSLRAATVSFVAWDMRQLEELELLYMRPGYTVLLEWGWTPYLNTAFGSLQNMHSSNFTDIINNTYSQEKLYRTLFEKSLAVGGNYDATWGKIQNYSWKSRPDGGYDCTTTIISIGEIIDSLKVNYLSSKSIDEIKSTGLLAIPGNQPLERVAKDYSKNIVAGICSELYDHLYYASLDNTLTKITTGGGVEVVAYMLPLDVDAPSDMDDTNSIIVSGRQIYITLKSFVDIMNKYVLLDVQNTAGTSQGSYVELSVNSSTITSDAALSGKPLLCLGDQFQLSTDPSICLIANTAWMDPYSNFAVNAPNYATDAETLITFIDQASKGGYDYFQGGDWKTKSYGVIGNIFVNLNYIYSLITNNNLASQDKKEKNDIFLYNFIKTMMSGIGGVTGNVANFDIHVDPTDGNIARIIDVNYVDEEDRATVYKNAFEFQMQTVNFQGRGSIIRNYNLESKIFPEQSTIVAIGAQVQGGALGANVNTLVDFNQNLTDRILPKKSAPAISSSPTNDSAQINAALTNAVKNLETLISFVTALTPGMLERKGDYDAGQSSEYGNALKDLINYFNSLSKSNNNNRGIIPTALSLEIDGIGGIVIGNIFKIPNYALPKGYRGGGAGPAKIGFLVKGLGHSIQNNDWVTKVEASFVILDPPRQAVDRLTLIKQGISIMNNQQGAPSTSPGFTNAIINMVN